MENKEESQSPKITSLSKLKEKRKYKISEEERARRKKNWEEKVKPSIVNRHKKEKENKEYETTLNDLIKSSDDEEIKIDLDRITLDDVKKKEKIIKKKFNTSDDEEEYINKKQKNNNKDNNINPKELKILLKSLLELQTNTKNKIDKLYYAKKNKNNKPKEEPKQPVIINTTKNTYEEDILKAMKSKILNI